MADKTVVRVHKNKDNPYVMLNKQFLSDCRLSWRSKGLLAYLLSKPDDWQIMIVDLVKQSKGGKGRSLQGPKRIRIINIYCS